MEESKLPIHSAADIEIAKMGVDLGYIKLSMDKMEKHIEILASSEKANPIQVFDHETRIRRLERWGITAIGALSALQFILSYFR